MAKPPAIPLDEIQHRRPDILFHFDPAEGRIVPDEVHRYVRESPFFDHATKNGLLYSQSETNGPTFFLVSNRRELEKNLSERNGTEYMIVGEPKQVEGAQPGESSEVWVVRKQDRRKRKGQEDEITVLGTYFIVNGNMYQAPSVADIIGNHMLSTMTSLSKFYNRASSLPQFTPSTGYSYLPPASRATQASPSRSREGSVAPGAGSDAQTQRSDSVAPTDQQGIPHSKSTDAQDTQLLARSLQMSLSYADEYMDENPLIGQPGAFTFTSTQNAVRKRKADEEAKAQAEQAAKSAAGTPKAVSPVVEKPPSPPAVMTESKAPPARKGSKMGDKAKRRKSKAANSPATPSSSTSAMGPTL